MSDGTGFKLVSIINNLNQSNSQVAVKQSETNNQLIDLNNKAQQIVFDKMHQASSIMGKLDSLGAWEKPLMMIATTCALAGATVATGGAALAAVAALASVAEGTLQIVSGIDKMHYAEVQEDVEKYSQFISTLQSNYGKVQKDIGNTFDAQQVLSQVFATCLQYTSEALKHN